MFINYALVAGGFVAPSAGAWIEIRTTQTWLWGLPSLPPRERGLKSLLMMSNSRGATVAPSAGAWIEICTPLRIHVHLLVAPSAGAWIEIAKAKETPTFAESLPPRERGLKCFCLHGLNPGINVAPSAGAWIEITAIRMDHITGLSLPPRERGLKSSLCASNL